jgi:hypothetical protein
MAARRLFDSRAWHAAAMRKSGAAQEDATWPEKEATCRGQAVGIQGISVAPRDCRTRRTVPIVDYSPFFSFIEKHYIK